MPGQVEVTRVAQVQEAVEGAVASKMGYREVVSNCKVVEESQSKVVEEPNNDKPVVKKEETNKVMEKDKCGGCGGFEEEEGV